MKTFLIITFVMLITFAGFAQDDVYDNTPTIQVSIYAQEAPPPLQEYEQPEAPGEDYFWQPGYWSWNGFTYVWVPGVWVLPPSMGLFWTPGYWAFYDGRYGWHRGYWSRHIGYYGGINYGYGYYGTGFYGGRWHDGHFVYNSAVWHVNHNVHRVYEDRTVIRRSAERHSFNGPAGVHASPPRGNGKPVREHNAPVRTTPENRRPIREARPNAGREERPMNEPHNQMRNAPQSQPRPMPRAEPPASRPGTNEARPAGNGGMRGNGGGSNRSRGGANRGGR